MVDYKNSKAMAKGWKVQKSDKPGPGNYKDRDKAFNLTLPRALVASFSKEKRIGFA